jgi:hypothetical protein
LLKARFPALFFANGIGDHFLNLPAARALARLFRGRLTLLCASGARSTFFRDLPLRRACEVPVTTTRGARSFDADGAAAAIGPCDLLISLNPWHSSSVDRLLSRLSPRASVGFFPAFHRRVDLNFSKHAAELAFDIPRALDRSLRLEDFSGPPVFARRFVEQASRIRRSFPPGSRVLAVHADTARGKAWPRRRFIRLLDSFLERRPDFLVLVLGWVDRGLDAGRHGDRVVGGLRLPLATSALLAGSADLFVGVDSCLLHAADLFRVAGVGIFGPTDPAEWGFRFAPHRHVRSRGSISTLREDEVLAGLAELSASHCRP